MTTVLLLLLSSPVVTDKTGYYSVETTTEYSRSGKVVRTEVAEKLVPAGTIIGKVGHSYYWGTCQGRELLLERDEKTYDGWWSAPPLKKAGRDLFGTPDSEAARMEEARKVGFKVGASSISHKALPARTVHGLVFNGQKIIFDDGSWTKEWSIEMCGGGIVLHSETERKGIRTVQQLTTLRKPMATDLAKLSISTKHPRLAADSRGMIQAMTWFQTGMLPQP